MDLRTKFQSSNDNNTICIQKTIYFNVLDSTRYNVFFSSKERVKNKYYDTHIVNESEVVNYLPLFIVSYRNI